MRRALLLAILVAMASLTATAWLFSHERSERQQRLREAFDLSLRQTTARIVQRIATFEQFLYGTKGFLLSSPGLDEAAFRRYVESLLAGTDLAGLRVAGFTSLTERPSDSPSASARISMIAPLSKDNERLRRFNQLSDPMRNATMRQAVDTGRIAITGRTRSTVDDDPGFVMFLALYEKEAPPDTIDDRRAKAIGWLFTSLKMRDLMGSLYGERIPGIIVRVYDGIEATPETLLFDSSPGTVPPANPRFHAEEYLDLYGRSWMVALVATPEFEERFSVDTARVIGIVGLGFSVLAALLTWQLASGREQAYALASKMTAELRESEAKLQQQAWFDPLTKLPNRTLFSDRLHSAMARATRHAGRFALLFIDLDRFKPVNDTYGHDIGDKLLAAVSICLRDSLREADTLGRIGGDEFVVLLPEINDIGDAQLVAEKIRVQLARSFPIGALQLEISCSIGIAVFPDHGSDEISLMRYADIAMYKDKSAGRHDLFAGV